MSKSHPQQWVINEAIERPDRHLVDSLGEFTTTQIADSGAPVGVIGPAIRRLAGGHEMCGPAVTVWTKPGDILFVLKATDMITGGDVLVVDGGGRTDAAVIGDIVGQTIADLGCVGLVVDGAVRDTDGLDDADLPSFARNAHPATGSNQGPGAINVTIQCGGVVVRPGDVIRGDASGLVVVPREHLESVLEMTRVVADRESRWRDAIAEGESLPSATGIDELIERLDEDRASPVIRNVVLGRLRPGVEPAAVEPALAAIVALRPDGLLDCRVGTDLRLRDGSWDFAITSDFVDEDAYRAYDREAEHNRVRRELFGPLCEEIVRVQFRT